MTSWTAGRSVRRRAAVRLVTFTDRVAQSLTVMKTSYERGIVLPETEPEERGAGKPLRWDD